MRKKIESHFLPVVIGFGPVLLMLLTWAPDGQGIPLAKAIKWFAAPVAVIELFVIIVALRRKMLAKVRVRRISPLLFSAFLVLTTIAFSTAIFVAPNTIISVPRTVMWMLHILFAASIMHLCGRDFEVRSVTTAYVFAFVLFMMLLVFFAMQVPDWESFDWIHNLPAVTHIRFIGFYAGAVLGLCIGRFALATSRLEWSFIVLAATLAFAFAIWSGSRGTVFAAGVGFVVALLLFPTLRQPKVLVGLFASAFMGLAIAYCLPVPVKDIMGFGRAIEATMGEHPATGRTAIWRATLNIVAERPLFGYGDGQLAAAAKQEWLQIEHPHNFFLQVILAWGILGALCVFALVFPVTVKAVRKVRVHSGELLPPAVALLVLAVYSTFDGVFYFPLPLSIVAACAGLLGAAARPNRV